MQDIVIKLLEKNDYKLISSVPEVGIYTYQSNTLLDVIIIAPYSTGDLNAFDQSDITHSVMDQFDLACKISPTTLKDTSLILCHRVEGIIDLEESKNTTLKIEENTYGFRKYVLPYTEESIRNIINIDTEKLSTTLATRLSEGFSEYAESNIRDEISEYETILRIYSKLPFLNYEREENTWNSLDSFLQEKLEAHAAVRGLVKSYTFDSQYSQTPDDEINKLLNSKEMRVFLDVNEEAA